MMYYMVAFCKECERWGTGYTKKNREDAHYTCKFCGKTKSVVSKANNRITDSGLDIRYFGEDLKKAQFIIQAVKDGRL